MSSAFWRDFVSVIWAMACFPDPVALKMCLGGWLKQGLGLVGKVIWGLGG